MDSLPKNVTWLVNHINISPSGAERTFRGQVSGKHGSLKRNFKHLPIELFLSDGGKKARGKVEGYDLSC